MLKQTQINYMVTLEEPRLLEYLKNRDLSELLSIQSDLKKHLNFGENLSPKNKNDIASTLVYIEAIINGLSQAEDINPDEEFINISQFKPLSSNELIETLGLTIKKDEINRLLTFLAHLSAYTEESQLNISFNAPSSSGKSYIPMEISRLFPEKDVIQVAYCSPTAFFHSHGTFNKEKQGYIVDLSKKILIFLDQPHTMLLQHLRPMLSHDKKEIQLKITDKSQKQGLKTKNIYLIGYPSVIFCTAGLTIDEQEATRFLLLSPEINQEKLREGILEKIKKDSDRSSYLYNLEINSERKLLKDRIRAIKQESITEINIVNPQLVEHMFMKRIKKFKPKHQRDIGRITSLVKIFALLNIWFREREEGALIANDEDIKDAFEIYDKISESQELNLPPYVFNLYKDIIVTLYKEKNNNELDSSPRGATRQEILKKHYQVYGRYLPDWQFRQQILPMLETSGLITQEQDPNNKRTLLIYPTTQLTVSNRDEYSEPDGGVT